MRLPLLVLLLMATNTRGPGSSDPPDACKMLTIEDVTAALGPGYTPGPDDTHIQTATMSGCQYRKDRLNFVQVSITPAEGGDSKAVLRKRRETFERKNRGVIEVPAVCSDAFVVALSSTTAKVMTAKGEWNTELEVLVDGKGDTSTGQTLARAICSRLP
jgi:hypothetical protein